MLMMLIMMDGNADARAAADVVWMRMIRRREMNKKS